METHSQSKSEVESLTVIDDAIASEAGRTAFELLAQSIEDGISGDDANMGLTRIPGGQTVPDN